MAFTADTGSYEAKRDDYWRVDPRALVVDYKKNLSRAGEEPPVDEELKALAFDMMPLDGNQPTAKGSSGQLNPILVRKLSDRRLEVVGGFRRMRAALWLIESGTCPDFKIKYAIFKGSDAEAALINVSENLQRENPKPIQTAHAIRTLMDGYGLTIKEISGRFKKSQGYVRGLLDLVTLPKPIQVSVAAGETPVSAALELAKIDGPEQVKVFQELAGNGERVTAKRVREKRQKVQEETGEGKPIPRTLKQVAAFVESKTGPGENGHKFACFLVDFIDGKRSEDDFNIFWDKYFGKKQIRTNDSSFVEVVA